jgi:hypothetical protein
MARTDSDSGMLPEPVGVGNVLYGGVRTASGRAWLGRASFGYPPTLASRGCRVGWRTRNRTLARPALLQYGEHSQPMSTACYRFPDLTVQGAVKSFQVQGRMSSS